MIVDDRPGADEMIGDEIIAKAPPDGYTIGIVSHTGITASPQLHNQVRYDPQKDFTPIFMLGRVTPVMVVPPTVTVRGDATHDVRLQNGDVVFVPTHGARVRVIGEVIRPAKLWCDTSTLKECEILTKKVGGEKAALRKGGLLFLPGFTAPKILWLKRNEPHHFKRLRHVLLPHDYLNFHLTGEYFMEYGDASGTGLMDVRKRTVPVATAAPGLE